MFDYVDVQDKRRRLKLEPNSLAFTICQTPVVLQRSDRCQIILQYANGDVAHLDTHTLDLMASQGIFRRDGSIALVTVSGPIGRE